MSLNLFIYKVLNTTHLIGHGYTMPISAAGLKSQEILASVIEDTIDQITHGLLKFTLEISVRK